MADDEILYLSMCYCAPCDRYFHDHQSRADHIQYSDNHPKCDKCNLRFANKNALRNHFTLSLRHHYCSLCRMHFQTAAGFRAHVQFASAHRDDSDDEDEDIDYSYDGWEDDVGRVRFPDENDSNSEPPVVLDNFIDPEDEYWDEDDVDEVDDEDEADYGGWGPVPSATVSPRPATDATSLPTPSLTPIPSVGTPEDGKPQTSGGVTTNAGSKLSTSESTPFPSGDVTVGCPLCLEQANQPCVTRCGHMFCSSCIVQALDIKRRCPVCRIPAGPKQLRKVYLSTPVANA